MEGKEQDTKTEHISQSIHKKVNLGETRSHSTHHRKKDKDFIPEDEQVDDIEGFDDEVTSNHSEIDLEKYKAWMARHPEVNDVDAEINYTDDEGDFEPDLEEESSYHSDNDEISQTKVESQGEIGEIPKEQFDHMMKMKTLRQSDLKSNDSSNECIEVKQAKEKEETEENQKEQKQVLKTPQKEIKKDL